MKLTFSNVGRFVEKTEVEINGITVIAGKNGTGKSTISKLLYCIFDSLHDTDLQIEDNRIASVERILSRLVRRIDSPNSVYDIAFQVIARANEILDREDILQLLRENNYPLEQIDEIEVEELLDRMEEVLQVSEEEILAELVFSRFVSEFSSRIRHVNFLDLPSEINLLIREKSISITLDQKRFALNSEFELIKDIVYLDDLSSLMNLSPRRVLFSGYDTYSHMMRLRKKIVEPKAKNNDALDKIIAEKRYSKVISKMNQLEIGELIKSSTGVMEYSAPGLESPLGMQNVSAGTKVLAVIKKLITNGYIEENGVIVLDEPEVHLHPEWQMALAEMIVIMQCELGVNVLITTHSADFVAFIQYYSQKMNIEQKCKYYKAIAKENYTSSLIDSTETIQDIFYDLGEPFVRVTEEENAE